MTKTIPILLTLGVFVALGYSTMPRSSTGPALHDGPKNIPIAIPSQLVRFVDFQFPQVHLSENEFSTLSLRNALDRERSTSVTRYSIDEYLNFPPSKDAAVLLSRGDGQFCIILGALNTEFGVRYQVMEATGNCGLYSAETIKAGNFEHVWQPRADYPTGYYVADLGVEFDKLWHNCGLVSPGETPTASFQIVNRGRILVECGPMKRSCGCLSTIPQGKFILMPGSSQVIDIKLVNGPVSTFAHSIVLPLRQADGPAKSVKLDVFGNSLRSMEIYPATVDFGNVARTDSVVQRTVRLRETPADRFSIRGLQATSHDLHTSWRVEDDSNGLKSYQVTLSLNCAKLSPGSHYESLNIKTTSDFHPSIQIPFQWKTKSDIELLPSVLAFGTILAGEPVSRELRVRSTTDATLSVFDIITPDNCSASLELEGSDVLVNVKLKPAKTGLVRERLAFSVKRSNSSASEQLQIEIVAFVRSYKE